MGRPGWAGGPVSVAAGQARNGRACVGATAIGDGATAAGDGATAAGDGGTAAAAVDPAAAEPARDCSGSAQIAYAPASVRNA